MQSSLFYLGAQVRKSRELNAFEIFVAKCDLFFGIGKMKYSLFGLDPYDNWELYDLLCQLECLLTSQAVLESVAAWK